MYSVTGT